MLLHILQYGAEQSSQGNAYTDSLYQFSQTGAFWLMIAVAVAGFVVQARLKSVFSKYSEVPSPNGMSGREAAEKMLRDNGITDVRVISTPGSLTDHFDPRNMTVNLSESVYSCRSVSAIAVACHECGHALQHASAYAPLVMRSTLVPAVSFSSKFSTWVLLAGILMIQSNMGMILCWVGIAMIAMTAIFSLITLPVEYNASSRALAWLEESGTAQGEQLAQAKEALSWAARTYLVAALSAIATLLYYVMMMLGRRRD